MSASQITDVPIVCSTVCSGADKKPSKLRVTGPREGNPPVTGGFSSQKSSNAENGSVWWRHHHESFWIVVCSHADAMRWKTLSASSVDSPHTRPVMLNFYVSLVVSRNDLLKRWVASDLGRHEGSCNLIISSFICSCFCPNVHLSLINEWISKHARLSNIWQLHLSVNDSRFARHVKI